MPSCYFSLKNPSRGYDLQGTVAPEGGAVALNIQTLKTQAVDLELREFVRQRVEGSRSELPQCQMT